MKTYRFKFDPSLDFLPPEELRWMGHAAEAYVAAQLERGFRTLDYYKQIKTN